MENSEMWCALVQLCVCVCVLMYVCTYG